MEAKLGPDAPISRGRVPEDWHLKRCLGRLRLLPDQSWLDLRDFETRESLRADLAETLVQLGLADLDISGVRGPSRDLTQAIARWAYEHGYQGIAYTSRFDDSLDCWAIFEGAGFEPIGLPEPIARDAPDLLAAAERFDLVF